MSIAIQFCAFRIGKKNWRAEFEKENLPDSISEEYSDASNTKCVNSDCKIRFAFKGKIE